jgi:hypothetical protein
MQCYSGAGGKDIAQVDDEFLKHEILTTEAYYHSLLSLFGFSFFLFLFRNVQSASQEAKA